MTSVDLQRTTWRISLVPRGSLTPPATALVAIVGPGACVVVGATLLAIAPELSLHGWYLVHAVFLLPMFGDGRALLRAALLGRPASDHD